MSDLIFLKLGGSLITDKTGVEAVRDAVVARLAQEIARARESRPGLSLVLGHGSGSFGHVAAAKYGTRDGVGAREDMAVSEQWFGYAEVSDAAARLNRIVVKALLEAGIPAVSLQPSASAVCANGRILSLALSPVRLALEAGIVPVVYGDVAFDTERGGTIISTEEILVFLAEGLRPSWLLLAGETDGVYDTARHVIPAITPDNFDTIRSALRESRGTDVTGGMASKVEAMLDLVQAHRKLTIRIFSGLDAGNLQRALVTPETAVGTIIASSG